MIQSAIWLLIGVAAGGIATIMVLLLLYKKRRKSRNLMQVLSKYVSPDVLKELYKKPSALAAKKQELTILCSSIAGYVTIAEKLPPEQLLELMKKYLSTMTEIILKNGGALDRFIADQILCYWGAPLKIANHAIKACECALEQFEAVLMMNAGMEEDMRIRVRMGINTGNVVWGNIGTPRKMNFTILGDAVNAAASLERLNKKYGTHVLVSESTCAAIEDRFSLREIDKVKVIGKTAPTMIYELIGEKEERLKQIKLEAE